MKPIRDVTAAAETIAKNMLLVMHGKPSDGLPALDTVLTNVTQWISGYPASSGGAISSTARTIPPDPDDPDRTPIPVDSTAEAAVLGRPDLFRQERDELDRRIERMRIDSDWLIRYVYRHRPTASVPLDQCTHCARHRHQTPAHRNELCRWCYDFHRSTGKLPPPVILDQHHQGRRIAIRDLARHGITIKQIPELHPATVSAPSGQEPAGQACDPSP